MPRKPKYGYARDIFGRVQERDRYKEDSTEKLDYDYEMFLSEEIQKRFLEDIQTSDNIKIEQSKK